MTTRRMVHVERRLRPAACPHCGLRADDPSPHGTAEQSRRLAAIARFEARGRALANDGYGRRSPNRAVFEQDQMHFATSACPTCRHVGLTAYPYYHPARGSYIVLTLCRVCGCHEEA